MINRDIYSRASAKFAGHFACSPAAAAYAPGRVEILGNHTDYNEGLVLSAAINFGTFFVASLSDDDACRIVAGDLMEEATFASRAPVPTPDREWANFVIGVFAGLQAGHGTADSPSDARTGRAATPDPLPGFRGLFLGNVPLGAGLSSSAALEISAALTLCRLYSIDIDRIALAKIGQRAEHEFVGAKCGLLDQVTSLFGTENGLALIDFRSLSVDTVPLGKDTCFLMCNTNVKHSLVASEYNERRERCESAAAFFARALDHPVTALRDVSHDELVRHSAHMDPVTARRASHVIGENARVLEGSNLLRKGDIDGFGKLMFESHESSRTNFENSCAELDFLVTEARRIPGVLGARLSGGGFGGSAVLLIHPRDVEHVTHAVTTAYSRQFGHACDTSLITPSAGARVITES